MTDRRRARRGRRPRSCWSMSPIWCATGPSPLVNRSSSSALGGALRSFEDAVAYPPNQVFIGNLAPAALWDTPRDWWAHPVDGASIAGPTGDIMDQDAFYALLAEVDQFELARMGVEPEPGQLPLYRGQDVVGAFAGDHELDESLTPGVLLENLSIKASGVHALQHLLKQGDVDPAIDHPRDRMRRRGGGRSLPARRRQRREGDRRALRSAERQRHRREVLLRGAGARPRGGGRPDRGRHRGTRRRGGRRVDRQARHEVRRRPGEGVPHHRGRAGRHGRAARTRRRLERPDRADRRGRAHAGGCRVGRRRRSWKRWWARRWMRSASASATSTPTPRRSTTRRSPSRRAAATSPTATTRCSRGSGSCAANSTRSDIAGFSRAHGMPGFSPTQGHIASAVPWLPHALARDARRRAAANDVDREGLAVPRPPHAAVGRRVRDLGSVTERCR